MTSETGSSKTEFGTGYQLAVDVAGVIQYSRAEMGWEQYVCYGLDIVGLIQPELKPLTAIAGAVLKQRQAITAAQAQARTARMIEEGLGQLIANSEKLVEGIRGGFSSLNSKVCELSGNVEALRADFNWGLGALLWQLETQQDTLKAILETLQAPLDTQARELRKRAEFAYSQGWYDDALRDFLASGERNPYDFAVYQFIGNIYLYGRQPADLTLAREYYLKAAKYARPHSTYYAALAHMYAGFVSYLQRDDEAAVEQARVATEIHPSLIEAFYNHAKFAAAAGRAEAALPSLERAIRADRNYAIKALTDADFDRIEESVRTLFERLVIEARHNAATQWGSLRERMTRYALPPCDSAERVAHLREDIAAAVGLDDNYFDCLDTLDKIRECEAAFDGLRLTERDSLLAEASTLLSRLRGEMLEYEVPAQVRGQLERSIAEAEQLAAGFPTYDGAQQARDGTVACEALWRNLLTTGHELSVLTGHEGRVTALAFSPDGTVLASGSLDQTVRLWEVASGRELAILRGHEGAVSALVFRPGGKILASGATDGTVRLWDVNSHDELAVEKIKHKPRIADNWRLAVDTSSSLPDWIIALAFSPDGKKLAASAYESERYPLGYEPVQVFELNDDPIYFRGYQRLEMSPAQEFWPSIDVAHALAFGPDGKIFVGTNDGHLCVWDMKNVNAYKRLVRDKNEDSDEREAHCGEILFLAYDAGGSTLFTGGGGKVKTWLWNNDGSMELTSSKNVPAQRPAAFEPRSMLLAFGGEGNAVRLWDVMNETELAAMKGHTSEIYDVAFDPNGTLLASGSDDNTVRLWQWAVRKV